jgi:hypothetical protein
MAGAPGPHVHPPTMTSHPSTDRSGLGSTIDAVALCERARARNAAEIGALWLHVLGPMVWPREARKPSTSTRTSDAGDNADDSFFPL